MNLEDTKKLVNGVIENEFNYIQRYDELNDTNEDPKINVWDEKTDNLLQQLLEVAPEHKQLLDDFDSSTAAYWGELCRYYFKKGVIAGTTNLKFLEDTSIMHLI